MGKIFRFYKDVDTDQIIASQYLLFPTIDEMKEHHRINDDGQNNHQIEKMLYGTVDIDMIAGPSEIMIIADESAKVEFLAADMLSQAEHDKLASSVLICSSIKKADKAIDELKQAGFDPIIVEGDEDPVYGGYYLAKLKGYF